MPSFPNKFCPHQPHPTQQRFLDLSCREAFFGGAAGGGKSDALLMAALMYADVAGYSALILRKDLQRLALASGLIPRSHAWLAGSNAQWNGARRQWTIPTKAGPPATLTFGYLAGPFDKFRYASSEFQYLGFDELTELREDDYLFLFSRLRRLKGIAVPLRVRSASNPGNIGHLWVKQRFVEREVQGSKFQVQGSGDDPTLNLEPETLNPLQDCMFVPSRIADNPSLDEAEYRATLLHLPPLERERLMNGDWNVQEQGLFHAAWLRYYVESRSLNPQPKAQASTEVERRFAVASGSGLNEPGALQLELLQPDGRLLAVIPESACRRFVTIDPAGTSADRQREARGRAASWTVVQVWDQPPRELARFLLLREQVRERVAFDGLCKIVRQVNGRWQPRRIWIEDEKLGHAAVSVLHGEGLPIEVIRTQGRDKVARASQLFMKMERGEIFLPRYDTSWRPAFEAELLAWTGLDDQPSDQIDAAAYAAIIASQQNPAPIKLQPIVVRS